MALQPSFPFLFCESWLSFGCSMALVPPDACLSGAFGFKIVFLLFVLTIVKLKIMLDSQINPLLQMITKHFWYEEGFALL